MRILCKIWAACLVAGVSIPSAFAQDAAPSAGPVSDVRAVRVRIGYVCGMCGGLGYRTSLTTVEPTFIMSELKDAPDKKKLPDTKTKRAITKKEWEELQRSIDTKALKALPQPATCLPCIDLPESYLAVEYSDGQRISVSYDPMNPPAPISALLRKVPASHIRLNP